jgi:hypothetical protein
MILHWDLYIGAAFLSCGHLGGILEDLGALLEYGLGFR